MHSFMSALSAGLIGLGFIGALWQFPQATLWVAVLALVVFAAGWSSLPMSGGVIVPSLLALVAGGAALALFLFVSAASSGQFIVLVVPAMFIIACLYFLAVPRARVDLTQRFASVMFAVTVAASMSGWLALSLNDSLRGMGVLSAVGAVAAAVVCAIPGPRSVMAPLGVVLGGACAFSVHNLEAVNQPLWFAIPMGVVAASVLAATLTMFESTSQLKNTLGAVAVGACSLGFVGILTHVVSLRVLAA